MLDGSSSLCTKSKLGGGNIEVYNIVQKTKNKKNKIAVLSSKFKVRLSQQ
jgi:hypothetical protein